MSSRHSHNYIDIPKEKLQKYYWGNQLTLKVISAIYNCSIKTIGCKMEEYGIPRRSMSTARKGIICKHSGQFKKGSVPWNKGLVGSENPNWKGGTNMSNVRKKAKRRNLGDTTLFGNLFAENILVDGHHISDGFVVYIPRSLHKNHLHTSSTKLHRNELKLFIESIYNISYIIEEGD